MNRFSRFIAYSMLAVAPALAIAQGNSGQMPRGDMMSQEQMQKMQENMARMQAMRQEMRNASSAEERRRIREKHLESMREHMDMMRGGMMGQGMMGQGMMGEDRMGQELEGREMMGQGQGMKENRRGMMNNGQGNRAGGAGMDNEQRMRMMENRMDHMQLMMEQMLEHQRQLDQN